MASVLVLVAASLSVGSTAVASPRDAQERAASRDLTRAEVVVGQLAAVLDDIQTLPRHERHGPRSGLAESSKLLGRLRRQVTTARRTAVGRVAALEADRKRLRRGKPTRADVAAVATLTRTTQLLLAEIRGLAGANQRITAAAGPATGTPLRTQLTPFIPTIVSVGDSYISGEAGRWAGNVAGTDSGIIDVGPKMYFDNNDTDGELIPGCHRAMTSEIHIFPPANVNSVNLACSGALTYTTYHETFKPGIDFYSSGSGDEGQATMLEDVAKEAKLSDANVKMVVLSIGGNDFHFGDTVTTCLEDFLLYSIGHRDFCKDDSKVLGYFTPAHIAENTKAIGGAIKNVNTAMTDAGYNSSDWTLVVQGYPDPLAPVDRNRYPDGSGRQSTGGCGLLNLDITWARTYALPTINAAVRNAVDHSGLPNIKFLNIQDAFVGHRLCENTVGLLPQPDFLSWTTPDAISKVEWVNQIHIATIGTDFFEQESLHPNYFGQFALRECLTLVYNNGSPRGGKCTRRDRTPQNNYVEQLN